MERDNLSPNPDSTFSDESFDAGMPHDGLSTRPRRGVVNKVCRDWLVFEDGALAHQLQSQEIEAYYGHNRHRNRLMRQDAPQARMEQEDELKQALAMQRYQQELREKQVKEDEEAARRLAAELHREEMASRASRSSDHDRQSPQDGPEIVKHKLDQVCNSLRDIDLHQPMSEEEAREWQELCDAELARKLQQKEEEESRYRRDITDLSRRLEIEARDRELARALYEKEKERLRRAKEKARQKAKNKAMAEQKDRESHCAVSPVQNIAVCIDPTWNGGRHQDLTTTFRERTSVPVTDLDFPLQPQQVTRGRQHDKEKLSEEATGTRTKSPICPYQ